MVKREMGLVERYVCEELVEGGGVCGRSFATIGGLRNHRTAGHGKMMVEGLVVVPQCPWSESFSALAGLRGNMSETLLSFRTVRRIGRILRLL